MGGKFSESDMNKWLLTLSILTTALLPIHVFADSRIDFIQEALSEADSGFKRYRSSENKSISRPNHRYWYCKKEPPGVNDCTVSFIPKKNAAAYFFSWCYQNPDEAFNQGREFSDLLKQNYGNAQEKESVATLDSRDFTRAWSVGPKKGLLLQTSRCLSDDEEDLWVSISLSIENTDLSSVGINKTDLEGSQEAASSQSKGVSKTQNSSETSLSERLRTLKGLYDDGLITEDDYSSKRSEILSDL